MSDAVTPRDALPWAGCCVRGPERWRERCRWTIVPPPGRCVRFDRRTPAERRRARSALAVLCGLGLSLAVRR